MQGRLEAVRTVPTPLLVVAAAALFVAAFVLAPRRNAPLEVADCDPGRANCRVALPGGGEIEFSLQPQPVRALTPLRVEAALTAREANAIEVSFTGRDMEMGENRVTLLPDKGRFGAQAMLPVCASGRMNWLATVVVTSDGRQSAVSFPFVVAGR